MEGPTKKHITVYAMPVHLLSLDGELSAHSTLKKAILHYVNNWARTLGGCLDTSIRDAPTLSQHVKTTMMEAIHNGVVPDDVDFDFDLYLRECEDVCHYDFFWKWKFE